MSGREYHWIMTITWPSPTGQGMRTTDGVIMVAAGERRIDVYQRLLDDMFERSGIRAANVLHFSLEPNDLSARRTR